MGRLGADASRMVEAARDLARKHRHEAVEPEHLLAALLANDRIEMVLAERALDREHLVERIASLFADWPAAGLYRDMRVDPVPSEAFEALLVRAGADRLMTFFRPVTFDELATAACTEPRLAPLFAESNAPPGSGKAFIAQAQTLALARGESAASLFHLLHVLVEQPTMATALREGGVDCGVLGEHIRKRLDEKPSMGQLLRPLYKYSGQLELVNVLLRSSAIETLLVDAGTSVFDVKRALVRSSGAKVVDDTLPEESEGNVDLVFHNDDFSTMEGVVAILDQCFAIGEQGATALMLRVHKDGSAVVRTCAASEARGGLEKARARAREAGMPLRISWRPHAPSE